ncbi:MAG: RNA methyltransferase [Muribaculaceae bacterium]|nr:RNA methyltransferase [Muribaculaceae bacterium]
MEQFTITRRLLQEFSRLDDARRRRQSGIFVAEGTKCVLELLATFHCRYLFARTEWLEEHAASLAAATVDTTAAVDGATLRQLTRLPSAPPVIAYFEQRPAAPLIERGCLTVALDRIQDPGNLGTIIRCCDWFGVRRIIADTETVDCYNPKAVQATMGALAHIEVAYGRLDEILADSPVPVFGTFLDGDDIYHAELPAEGVIVLGNEGRGISEAVGRTVTKRLYIPPYPADASHVESLNVGMAAAIVLSQFRSRHG